MVGKTKDPKGTRITVRISDKDLRDLQTEAKRRNISVGGVIRTLIRDGIRLLEPAKRVG
ncbi:MAG TPA: ribbon-helix-helix protein, CopG family [Polyangia bacterium]